MNEPDSKSSIPFFSIITVVRNNIKYIESSILSVVYQKYSNFEYIIVDGGSTDGTLDIIKKYESKINKILSEADDGISDAFNKGVSLAKGDYLIFLNSDDFFVDTDVLGLVAEVVVKSHYPTFLYGNCRVISRDDGRFEFCADTEFQSRDIWKGSMPPHPSLFSSRLYFEKYGVFDLAYKVAMDFEWLTRGVLEASIVHMPFITTNVRAGGMSTLNIHLAKLEIYNALNKNGHFPSKYHLYKFKLYFWIRGLLKNIAVGSGVYAALRNIYFDRRIG